MKLINKTKQFVYKTRYKISCSLDKNYSSEQFSHNQIFSMLLPLILDQFFIFFISMLTASMISASSEASVAAVSLVNPLSFLVNAMFFAVSAGGTVIVAQYKGKGDEKTVKRAAGQVVLSTFVVAVFFATLMFFFADPLVHLIYGGGKNPTDPIVLDKAIDYLRGFSLSIPTFAIYNGVFSVLRGLGNTKVCLHLTIIINVIHLVASMVFINILKLDILGTALSYNVARIIGGIIAIIIIFDSRRLFYLRPRHVFTFNLKLQKSIIKMGIPFAIEQVFLNFGMIFSQMYMVGLGTQAIAANSITASISSLFYGAGFGVATLAITVIGQCIGAGDIKLARHYGKKFITMGCVVMTCSVAVLYPLTPLLLKLFAPEASTLPIIYQLLLIGIIPIPFFWSLSNVLPSVLRAAGDASYTSLVSLSSMWIFRIALGYTLAIPLGIGVHGIWIAMVVEWAVRSLLFYIRFKGDKWCNKKVI